MATKKEVSCLSLSWVGKKCRHGRILLHSRRRLEPGGDLSCGSSTGPGHRPNQVRIGGVMRAKRLDRLLLHLIGGERREQRQPSSCLICSGEASNGALNPPSTYPCRLALPGMEYLDHQGTHLW